jgi:hypothetical protein
VTCSTARWSALLLALWCVAPSIMAREARHAALTASEEKALLAHPDRIPKLLAEGALHPEQVPNPHWREDACEACHAGRPTRGHARLRETDVNQRCNVCHEGISDHGHIHPVAMEAPADMVERMPKAFRRTLRGADNALTCATCHDSLVQCLPGRARHRSLNPRFLRGAPYRTRFDVCFRCHDKDNYRRLGAHDQVTDAGEVRKARCRLCHEDTQHLATARGMDDLSFTVEGDLSALCTRCHESVPHPSGGFTFLRHGTPNHLVKPSPDVLARMREMQARQGIILPLDPNTGRIFCGTCHNVHERGVIERHAAAQGADSEHRLRSPKLCLLCHVR